MNPGGSMKTELRESFCIFSVRYFIHVSYRKRRNLSAKVNNIIIYYFVCLPSCKQGTKPLGLWSWKADLHCSQPYIASLYQDLYWCWLCRVSRMNPRFCICMLRLRLSFRTASAMPNNGQFTLQPFLWLIATLSFLASQRLWGLNIPEISVLCLNVVGCG